MTGRVTGIGGLFIRSENPKALAEWYETHLGIDQVGPEPWKTEAGATVFAPFSQTSDYFRTDRRFMVNFRVDGLDALIARLEAAGIMVKHLPDEGYGRFAHLEDPEGNPIELWEPGS